MAIDAKFEKAQAISARNNGVYGSDAPTTAYVIGNVGDPGLTSDYFCDIKSRFVLAVKQPRKRPLVKQGSDGSSIFLQDNIILVLRPKALWIDCPKALNAGLSGPSMNLTKLQRVDQSQNINVGKFSNFTVNNITSINKPYTIGEQITITKLKDYVTADDTPFQSFFPMLGLSQYQAPYIYPNLEGQGQTLPNTIGSNGQVVGGGKDSSYFVQGNNYFYVTLPKTDYETFLAGFFPAQNYNPAGYLPPNYEYYFGSRQYITFRCASYVDLNVGMKARDGNTSCLPTIVAPPDSFLTPQQRASTYFYWTQI